MNKTINVLIISDRTIKQAIASSEFSFKLLKGKDLKIYYSHLEYQDTHTGIEDLINKAKEFLIVNPVFDMWLIDDIPYVTFMTCLKQMLPTKIPPAVFSCASNPMSHRILQAFLKQE